jgi:hypothetical protein
LERHRRRLVEDAGDVVREERGIAVLKGDEVGEWVRWCVREDAV